MNSLIILINKFLTYTSRENQIVLVDCTSGWGIPPSFQSWFKGPWKIMQTLPLFLACFLAFLLSCCFFLAFFALFHLWESLFHFSLVKEWWGTIHSYHPHLKLWYSRYHYGKFFLYKAVWDVCNLIISCWGSSSWLHEIHVDSEDSPRLFCLLGEMKKVPSSYYLQAEREPLAQKAELRKASRCSCFPILSNGQRR